MVAQSGVALTQQVGGAFGVSLLRLQPLQGHHAATAEDRRGRAEPEHRHAAEHDGFVFPW